MAKRKKTAALKAALSRLKSGLSRIGTDPRASDSARKARDSGGHRLSDKDIAATAGAAAGKVARLRKAVKRKSRKKK